MYTQYLYNNITSNDVIKLPNTITTMLVHNKVHVNVASESDDFNEFLPRLEVLSDDESEDTVEFIPEEFYKEWIRCQSKYTIKIMALILMDTFKTRFGLTDVAAATEAGLVVGYKERSIRDWRKEFYDNEGEFHESLKGKYHQPYVLDDKHGQKKLLLGCMKEPMTKISHA